MGGTACPPNCKRKKVVGDIVTVFEHVPCFPNFTTTRKKGLRGGGAARVHYG
jgi:hypothetical protein